MNDSNPPTRDELQRLFEEYSDSLGAPSRTPPKRQPRRPRGLALALAGVLLAAIAVFTLWPRDAVAARIRRMGQAIKNARTMEMTYSTRMPSGKWDQWLRVRYSGRNWRYDGRKGAGQGLTDVVHDGMQLVDYHRLDHATLGPSGFGIAPEFEGEKSALDYALGTAGSSSTDEIQATSTRDHPDVDGRPAYAIVVDRRDPQDPPRWSSHVEILVDKRTDYPIRADIAEHREGENGGDFNLHLEYRFNVPLDPKLFDLTCDKPVVDLRQSQSVLAKMWLRPLAKVGEMQVRDASVTRDGTVWIVATTSGKDATIDPHTHSAPAMDAASDDGAAVCPDTLTVAGADYVRMPDILPIVGNSSFLFQGQRVVVVGFVPLEVLAQPPFSAVASFRKRMVGGINPYERTKAIGSARLDLTLIAGATPPCFPWLNMDFHTISVPPLIWHVRADGLSKQGRLLDAAHAYERAAKEYENFVKYIGYRELDKAAECYDKLGMTAEADRDRRLAAALHASRER